MAKYCLVKNLSDEFKRRLKSGEIDPEKLGAMTSRQRHDYFAEFLGEVNAKNVNTLFERRLLQTKRWDAMLKWAKEVTGITPAVRRDIITKIESAMKKDEIAREYNAKVDSGEIVLKPGQSRKAEILSPENEDAFLEDLAGSKLGVNLSFEEAQNIVKMSKELTDATKALGEGGDELRYGNAKVALERYMADLKLKTKEALPKGVKERVLDVAGASKGIASSLDLSAFLRQGVKTLFTNPTIWGKNVGKTMKDLVTKFGDEGVMDGIKAEIYSRQNARDGIYKNLKLDIGEFEEAYPSTIPEKIPVFKNLYIASQNAYTGFLYRMRADLADSYINMAKKQGVDLTDEKEAKSIGKMINSMTGRGDLGSGEKIGKQLNVLFFSPKFLKSNIDFLTAHQFQKGVTPFVRKQAAKNLAKVVVGMASTLALAEALHPGSVETDPRSSNFGKIKIGNTRFDISGGMGSLITLAVRQAMGSSKNSSTDKITKFGSGFGQTSRWDVASQFFEGKLSPAAGLIRDLMKGSDFEGNPVTVTGALSNLFIPMPAKNAYSNFKTPGHANIVLTTIADGLGIGANTYAPSTTNWQKSESKELKQLKEKLGDKTFKKANEEYNNLTSEKIAQLVKTEAYQKLSDDDKEKALSKVKDATKESIFRKYRFYYRSESTSQTNSSLNSMVSKLNIK